MTLLACFKAYDVRGRLGTEIDVDIAYRIGRAFGEFLWPDNGPREVVVGGDVRLTSEGLRTLRSIAMTEWTLVTKSV